MDNQEKADEIFIELDKALDGLEEKFPDCHFRWTDVIEIDGKLYYRKET